MDYSQSIFLVLLFLLILLVYTYPPTRNAIACLCKQEHFDTYYNHDFGAQEVYGYDDTTEATLRAKYTWKEQDPDTGLNVYDKYYEDHVHQTNWNDAYLMSAAFPASEMKRDKFPTTVFNGEAISLAQANY